MDPLTIGALAIPLFSKLFGGGGGGQQQQQSDALNKQMEQLLGLQNRRMQQSEPLYQAIQQLAMSLMPAASRGGMGGQMPGMPPQRAIPRPGSGLRQQQV